MPNRYLSPLTKLCRLLYGKWVDAVVRTGTYSLTRTALSEWYNE
ncbi:hypothetical protein ACLUEY_10220 [Vreelandella aquamarina]